MSSDTEEISQFRPIDLPIVPINSEIDSSDGTDLDDSTGFSSPSTPATPSTPVTPATPLSQLATSVSSFGFSDTGTSTFSVPRAKRPYTKKLTKKRGFQKGDAHPKRRLFEHDSPPPKKRSLSPLIRGNRRIPYNPHPYDVFIKKGGQTTSKSLYVPHGSELMNMDILWHFISLVHCNEPHCGGTLRLHKLPRSNGLQSSFVLHCYRCHLVVAEFSSSLHIGESPQEVVNSQTKHSKEIEVNSRALLAVTPLPSVGETFCCYAL